MKVGALQLLSRLSSGLASTLPDALHLDQPLGMLVDDGAAAQSVTAMDQACGRSKILPPRLAEGEIHSLSPGQKERSRGIRLLKYPQGFRPRYPSEGWFATGARRLFEVEE
jgi:hypothetical protein